MKALVRTFEFDVSVQIFLGSGEFEDALHVRISQPLS